MKYFAKYLPAEGEIKEGDKTLLKRKNGTYAVFTRRVEDDPNGWGQLTKINGHIPLQLDSDPSYVQYTHPRNLKKYKLFLCSRDIKIGDKVYHPLSLGDELIVLEKDPGENWEGGSWMLLSDVNETTPRRIGEISPEATWVKEEDEFDEDDIKKYAELPPKTLVPWIEENEKLGYKTVIKIKCPTCKTFH